jgi:alpha(1,3/1,4) fucosyltransferase
MKKLIFLLLPLFLWAAEHPRKKQINLVQAWSKPNDQGFVQGGLLGDIYKNLQEKNFRLIATDLKNDKDISELTYVVVWSKPHFLKDADLNKFPKKKLIAFLWEPPVFQKSAYEDKFLDKFKRIYTWDDDLVDNKKFFKFYYPVLAPMIKDLPAFEEKKLLVQMSSNKKSKHAKELYKERESVIRFFEEKQEGDFDFYGPAWEKKGYKNYRGMVDNKIETVKNYRFSVCYENMRDVKGYVTEKIFDCFAAGNVPIYWGASNITDFIPKNCFIDRRDFKDFNEVYEFVRAMDKTTYETYIKNIQAFLKSDQAKLFSKEMFEVIFLESIRFP